VRRWEVDVKLEFGEAVVKLRSGANCPEVFVRSMMKQEISALVE
jgi:hypothetical protein